MSMSAHPVSSFFGGAEAVVMLGEVPFGMTPDQVCGIGPGGVYGGVHDSIDKADGRRAWVCNDGYYCAQNSTSSTPDCEPGYDMNLPLFDDTGRTDPIGVAISHCGIVGGTSAVLFSRDIHDTNDYVLNEFWCRYQGRIEHCTVGGEGHPLVCDKTTPLPGAPLMAHADDGSVVIPGAIDDGTVIFADAADRPTLVTWSPGPSGTPGKWVLSPTNDGNTGKDDAGKDDASDSASSGSSAAPYVIGGLVLAGIIYAATRN